MEMFSPIEEICGQNLEKMHALFALPENGMGLYGRAIEATKSEWPHWYAEYAALCEKILIDEKWGFVYILKGTHGGVTRHKIGKANDLKNRRDMFNVKIPFDIDIEMAFRVPNALGVERRLHILMAEKRIVGEWFDLNPADMLKVAMIGFQEETAAWSRVHERIAKAAQRDNQMPSAEYIEYLETLLVMNKITFEKKEPTYG